MTFDEVPWDTLSDEIWSHIFYHVGKDRNRSELAPLFGISRDWNRLLNDGNLFLKWWLPIIDPLPSDAAMRIWKKHIPTMPALPNSYRQNIISVQKKIIPESALWLCIRDTIPKLASYPRHISQLFTNHLLKTPDSIEPQILYTLNGFGGFGDVRSNSDIEQIHGQNQSRVATIKLDCAQVGPVLIHMPRAGRFLALVALMDIYDMGNHINWIPQLSIYLTHALIGSDGKRDDILDFSYRHRMFINWHDVDLCLYYTAEFITTHPDIWRLLPWDWIVHNMTLPDQLFTMINLEQYGADIPNDAFPMSESYSDGGSYSDEE